MAARRRSCARRVTEKRNGGRLAPRAYRDRRRETGGGGETPRARGTMMNVSHRPRVAGADAFARVPTARRGHPTLAARPRHSKNTTLTTRHRTQSRAMMQRTANAGRIASRHAPGRLHARRQVATHGKRISSRSPSRIVHHVRARTSEFEESNPRFLHADSEDQADRADEQNQGREGWGFRKGSPTEGG